MKKRTVLMGADQIVIPLLEWLVGEGTHYFDLVEVVSQPDRPFGRGQRLTNNPLAQRAKDRDIPLYQPEKPTTELVERWKKKKVEIVLVMAYGHLLKKDILNVPEKMLNFHTSLLPKLRGASPIETAIAEGESETGICLMEIVEKMDAGNIFGVEKITIGKKETGGTLREKLGTLAVKVLAKTATAITEGTLTGTPQNDNVATYCRKLQKEDGALDFSCDADTLAHRIQGFTPSPGAHACLEGVKMPFKLRDATALKGGGSATKHGYVSDIGTEGMEIQCGKGRLTIQHLQRHGGKFLPAEAFDRGMPLKGKRFKSVPMTTLLRNT